MTIFIESTIESTALAWLENRGWSVKHCPNIGSTEPAAERFVQR